MQNRTSIFVRSAVRIEPLSVGERFRATHQDEQRLMLSSSRNTLVKVPILLRVSSAVLKNFSHSDRHCCCCSCCFVVEILHYVPQLHSASNPQL